MGYFNGAKGLVAILALVVLSTGCTAIRAKDARIPIQVCLSENGKPTSQCVEADRLALRSEPAGTRGKPASDQVELTFQVGARDLDFVRSLGRGGTTASEGEICIINGANICPPEPFEIVWICITTGMLAGSECPHPPEASVGPIVTVKLQSGRRPSAGS